MTTYTIKRGDTLSKIAKQFGVSLKQLQEVNKIKNANLIFAGKTLSIPTENDDAFKLQGLSVEHQPVVQVVEEAQNTTKPQSSKKEVKANSTDSPISDPYPYKNNYKPKDGRELRVAVKAVDVELLKKHGVEPNQKNDPNGKAQYVYVETDGTTREIRHNKGKVLEDGRIGCVYCPVDLRMKDPANNRTISYGNGLPADPASFAPDIIQASDSTHATYESNEIGAKIKSGVVNNYLYVKVEPGNPEYNVPHEGGPYYVLKGVDNSNGEEIKLAHTELYRLEVTHDLSEPGIDRWSYNLIQDEGMEGSGKSSIDYNKRKG